MFQLTDLVDLLSLIADPPQDGSAMANVCLCSSILSETSNRLTITAKYENDPAFEAGNFVVVFTRIRQCGARPGKTVRVRRRRKVEHTFEPVKSFKPNDTFALLVYLSEAKVGTRVNGVWTLVEAGGLKNTTLLEKKIELTADAIKSVKEPNRLNFGLEHDDPYPAGNYKVEIYLNGDLAKTVEFKIK